MSMNQSHDENNQVQQSITYPLTIENNTYSQVVVLDTVSDYGLDMIVARMIGGVTVSRISGTEVQAVHMTESAMDVLVEVWASYKKRQEQIAIELGDLDDHPF